MHSGEYRINGGVGFAIDAPACNLVFDIAHDFVVDDKRSHPLADEEQAKLVSILQVEKQRWSFSKAIAIKINGSMPTHSGFGSSTAITLGCLEALHVLNDSMPSMTELIKTSGRGGTSGVGIHTYFSGGCVFDLGRVIEGKPHVPSHKASVFPLPLMLDHLPMPEWDIGICIPPIPHKSQAEELAFFKRVCPIPKEDAYEAIYHALFGIYAAIREGNKVMFGQAVQAIQECAWKKAERSEYGAELMTIEQALYDSGADAVGMSSLGPGLFFLAEDVASVIEQMRQKMPECECLMTRPMNSGRKLSDA